jgi:hypothetical protein
MQTVLRVTFVASWLVLSACQNSPSGDGARNLASDCATNCLQMEKVTTRASVTGSEVVTIGQSGTYQLNLPAGMTLTSATWNFGDGTAPVNSMGPISHVFNRLGLLSLSVTLTDSNGASSTVSMTVNVLDYYDGLECVVDTLVSTPTDGIVGIPVDVSVRFPKCFAGAVKSLKWTFGDTPAVTPTANAQHIYSVAGDYSITLQVMSPYAQGAFLTFIRPIHIADVAPTPTPTPSPTATPVPTPTPTPHPLSCPTAGATRQSYVGEEYMEEAACGMNGKKKQYFKLELTESCSMQNGQLLWTEVSRLPVLQSEGPCEGQSCNLPDGGTIKDGESHTYYSSQTPATDCASASETRTCSNGILTGSFEQPTCHNACPGFGPHGTSHAGVVTGEEQVELVCAFGETGYFDIFDQLSTETCTDGNVVRSDTHRGSVKTPGACPVYQWTASENWTACTANCGGEQSRVFECKNDKGVLSPDANCESAAPVEKRACDGNPSAVAREDRTSTQQDSGRTQTCPANQIGVVVSTRTATNVKAYACVDHQVQMVSDTMEYTPWLTESYCRNYVAYRCSNDSLNNTQAAARYSWMLKCQDSVPIIKEFLAQFAGVSTGSGKSDTAAGNPNKAGVTQVPVTDNSGFSISSGSRRLYPTFMDHATNPEQTWIAPIKASASCDVPSTAYVAAVCVSSCATPEQEIIAQAKANLRLKSVPFIEALTENYGFVGTLQSQSQMTSMSLQKTKVEQWVTELVDTDHDILEFSMRSGGHLRLTPNHPLVAKDGSIKLAQDFVRGDSLVKLGGHLDEIVSIDQSIHHGKVYNLFVQSADLHQNIVVTGGYLNGTAFYQNEGADNVNRQILRNQLVRGIFGQ